MQLLILILFPFFLPFLFGFSALFSATPLYAANQPPPPPPIVDGPVFHILAAEMSGYRGDLENALTHYDEIYTTISNPKLYERIAIISKFTQDATRLAKILPLWRNSIAPNLNDEYLAAKIHLSLLQEDWQLLHRYAQQYYLISASLSDEKLRTIAKILLGNVPASIATSVFDSLYSLYPKDVAIVLSRVNVALFYKKTSTALSLAKQAYDAFDENPDVALLYAKVLTVDNKSEEALAMLKKANRRIETSSQLSYVVATTLLREGKNKEGLRELKRLISFDATHLDGLRLLSLSLISETKTIDDAYPYLNQLLDYPQTSNFARYYLGLIALDRKQHLIAEEHFRTIDRGPHYLNARLAIATLYQDQGKPNAAIDELTSLSVEVQGTEKEAKVVASLVHLLAQQKKHAQAMQTLDTALARLPNESEFYYQKAMLAIEQDQYDKALVILKDSLKSFPNNPTILNAYGYTLAEHTERYQEAKDYIEEALVQEPHNPAILDSMGFVLLRLGNIPEAKEYLLQAYEKQEDPEIGAHLIELYFAEGNKRKARRLFRKLIKKYPNSKHLNNVKAQFSL